LGYQNYQEKMLAIFNKGLVDPPKELNCPANSQVAKGKSPEEIVRIFQQAYPHNSPLSLGFGNSAFLAFSPSNGTQLHNQRYSSIIIDLLCFLFFFSVQYKMVQYWGVELANLDDMSPH